MKKLIFGLVFCALASTAFAQKPFEKGRNHPSYESSVDKETQDDKQKRIQNHRKKQKRIQDHRKKQKRIGDSKDGVQRKGVRPLQQPKKRGEFFQRGQERWHGHSWSPRVRGCYETPNKSGGRQNRRRKVQDVWMRFGNSVKQPSYGNDKRKDIKRGKQDCQCGSCGGAKSSPRKNPLQRTR